MDFPKLREFDFSSFVIKSIDRFTFSFVFLLALYSLTSIPKKTQKRHLAVQVNILLQTS